MLFLFKFDTIYGFKAKKTCSFVKFKNLKNNIILLLKKKALSLFKLTNYLNLIECLLLETTIKYKNKYFK